MKYTFFASLLCCFFSVSVATAQDELLDKIKYLEQQIQELKSLKEQQELIKIKSDQCMKVVYRDKFCSCIANNLPKEVSFEQYVHTLVYTKESLGYSTMSADQKSTVDVTLDAREKCIEKGFFK